MSKRGATSQLAGLSFNNIVSGSRKRVREEDEGEASTSTSATPSKSSNQHNESPQEVLALGHKLMHILYHVIDPTDLWPLANYFLECPSPKQYPDYYQVIKKPQALGPIKKKMVSNNPYKTYDELKQDCELVCTNAKKYNQNGSLIWNKAKALQTVIKNTFEDLIHEAKNGGIKPIPVNPNLPPSVTNAHSFPGSTPAPSRPKITIRAPKKVEPSPVSQPQASTSSTIPAKAEISTATGGEEVSDEEDDEEEDESESPSKSKQKEPKEKGVRKDGSVDKRSIAPKRGSKIHSKFKKALNKILKLKGKEGQFLSEFFMQLPDKKAYPDYYLLVKNPISLDVIKEKIEKKKYKNFLGFVEDLRLIAENAIFYNQDTSEIAKDAYQFQNWIERVLIPSYVADGFTLDKNDTRASVLPPDEATIAAMPKTSDTYKILMSRKAGVADAMDDGEDDESKDDIAAVEPPSKKLKLKVGPRPSIGTPETSSMKKQASNDKLNQLAASSSLAQGSSTPLQSLNKTQNQSMGPPISGISSRKGLADPNSNSALSTPGSIGNFPQTPSLSRNVSSSLLNNKSNLPSSLLNNKSNLPPSSTSTPFSPNPSSINQLESSGGAQGANYQQHSSNAQVQSMLKRQQKEEEMKKLLQQKEEERILTERIPKVNVFQIPTVRGIRRESVVPVLWVEQEASGKEEKEGEQVRSANGFGKRNLLKNDFVRQHSVTVEKDCRNVMVRFGLKGVRDVTKIEEEKEQKRVEREIKLEQLKNGNGESTLKGGIEIESDENKREKAKPGKLVNFKFEILIKFNGKVIKGEWKTLDGKIVEEKVSRNEVVDPSSNQVIKHISTSPSICTLNLTLPDLNTELQTSLLEISISPPPPNVGLSLIALEPLERPTVKPKGRWGWRGNEKLENDREMARELMELGDEYRVWFVR